ECEAETEEMAHHQTSCATSSPIEAHGNRVKILLANCSRSRTDFIGIGQFRPGKMRAIVDLPPLSRPRGGYAACSLHFRSKEILDVFEQARIRCPGNRLHCSSGSRRLSRVAPEHRAG